MQDGNIILNPLLSVKFWNAAHIYPDKCQILVHLSFFVFFFNLSAWWGFKSSNSEPWRWALFHPPGNSIVRQESHIALWFFVCLCFVPEALVWPLKHPERSSQCWKAAAIDFPVATVGGVCLQGQPPVFSFSVAGDVACKVLPAPHKLLWSLCFWEIGNACTSQLLWYGYSHFVREVLNKAKV